MHVIWKRPDGFHAASPGDYSVVEVGDNARLWLHKHDTENYPFRVSGGWQDEQGTVRLNQLVNLLNKTDSEWGTYLGKLFAHSENSDPRKFVSGILTWLEELAGKAKGDTWEKEIIKAVLFDVKEKLAKVSEKVFH